MRKLIAIALFALPGCANLSRDWDNWIESQGDAARTLQRMFQQSAVHAQAGKDRTDAEVDQELEEMRAQWAREDEARRKKEAEEEEATKRTEAEREHRKEAAEALVRERIADAEARGYVFVSFGDLFLDYKTIPLGSKRAVSALYQAFGELETLTAMPSNNPFDGRPRVTLLMDKAPRDVRARLLTPICRVAFCQGTFLGHTAECTVPRAGYAYRTTCFAVEEMW